MENSEIILYQTEDGLTKVEVKMDGETVWLTANQMAVLFDRDEKTIRKHINNVFAEGELNRESNTQKMRVAGVAQPVAFYNLDVIISVGYRVKSLRGTQFRIWANSVLREYLIKGYAMDDDRLKQLGGGNYWKELLDRIRDIRSSEKVLYRQVLDLYATSADYDPKSPDSAAFFKIVQNKLHFAAHGHTAAEVIFERADAEKPFMGMTSFSGEFPTIKDIGVAKNYLTEEELKILNNLVSGYFDFAEIQAMRHTPMYMKDYIRHLDAILSSTGEKLLSGAGTVSHVQAMEKAKTEYRKFRQANPSPVERAYMESLRALQNTAEKESKKR